MAVPSPSPSPSPSPPQFLSCAPVLGTRGMPATPGQTLPAEGAGANYEGCVVVS